MLLYDRLQFGFTAAFHYLFPQLTMGLALYLVFWKSVAFFYKSEAADRAARFWTRIFALSFAFGVVTGIPMEFEFGTNWSAFSRFAGEPVGQLLAMEGVFAFFLESSFLGIVLFGERKLGSGIHWFATCMLFLGSWVSAYLILATNAWMQHPVGYSLLKEEGAARLTSLPAVLGNPWLFWQFLHNMSAAVVTASFVIASVGAFYQLAQSHLPSAGIFLRTAVLGGSLATILVMFPTGDHESQQVFAHQPVKAAAMEGIFHTEKGAPLILVGQPNLETQTLDNPIFLPDLLSVLTYHRFAARVAGLDAFPRELWPDNIPLVYYAYHIMVGLGTILAAVMTTSLIFLLRGRLSQTPWLLWTLLLSAPFPYIATTAGWITAEAGRQPWVVYGVLKTAEGISPGVNAGNALFSFLGFLGLYLFLGILFLLLVLQQIGKGPRGSSSGSEGGYGH
ncbi:MAG: cytochrome ubiquinol oxidase subunit I [Candidatus Methylacidiphilaceae bacterium]